MADGVDIGALAGRVEFEDRTTATLDLVLKRLDELDAKAGNANASVVEMAAGFGLAELAIKGFDKVVETAVELLGDFTVEGAGMADVAENFERLNANAGRLSSTLLNELRDGTHNTITDFELMKSVNDAMAAGVQMTDQQYRTLADGGFALAQAKGINVKEAFDTINDALITGRTRSLQYLTGKIDLAKAEDDFARSLGTTADRLNEEGKLQAARVAILDAVGAATNRLGKQTDGVDEMVAQMTTAWANFYEELQMGVATSPAVQEMFITMRDAVVEAFGGDSQEMAQTFIDWVNKVAEKVTEYGPSIINAFVKIKDWVVDVYTTVRAGWDTLPDWFKNAAVNSALATAGFLTLNAATKVASGGTFDLIGTMGNLTTTLSGMPQALSNVSNSLALAGGAMKTLVDVRSFGDARAAVNLLGESVGGFAGKLGVAGLMVGAFFAAWEVGKMEPVSDFFEKVGLRLQGFTKEEAELAVKTHHALEAQEAQAEVTRQQEAAIAKAKEMMAQLTGQTGQLAGATDSANAVLEKNKFILEATREELKKRADAMAEIKSAGEDFHDTIKKMDEGIVKAVKGYLEAGVSQQALATAYGLTATQLQALVKLQKEEEDALKLQIKQVNDAEKRWADYYALMTEMSGTATDQVEADIERWMAAQIKSHKEAKTDTSDFYAWLRQMERAFYDQAAQQRLESDQNSKAYWQRLKADAEDAYEFALMHADQFTQGYIAELEKTKNAARDAAENWERSVAESVDNMLQKVRLLSGEWVTLEEKMRRQAMGGSIDVDSGNFQQMIRESDMGGRIGEAEQLAKEGYSFEEIMDLLRRRKKKGPPKGPRIPGFEFGGEGDFGDGTLVMLHGRERITPLDKGDGGTGKMVNNFYINGADERSARVMADIIMKRVKIGRKFGSA